VDEEVERQGFFSVLRWRPDSTRDEARNVAVILVDEEGLVGGVRHAPVSQISPRLHDQGIVDAALAGLTRQFAGDHKPNVGALRELYGSMRHSLCLTEPRPTAVSDPDLVLSALYRAYVAPRGGGGSRSISKGALLDTVVNKARNGGFDIGRGRELGGFVFDAVVDVTHGTSKAIEVLSFATTAQKWMPAEHDAGHFLYALSRVELPGLAVVVPPTEASHQNAVRAHERVTGWFADAGVPTTSPDEVIAVLGGVQRLL